MLSISSLVLKSITEPVDDDEEETSYNYDWFGNFKREIDEGLGTIFDMNSEGDSLRYT